MPKSSAKRPTSVPKQPFPNTPNVEPLTSRNGIIKVAELFALVHFTGYLIALPASQAVFLTQKSSPTHAQVRLWQNNPSHFNRHTQFFCRV